jgi:glycosyltransferase involved in cell wall biosynthesis
MRILYYNWVDYLDPEKRGGGVTGYQKNVIDSLAGRPELDIVFLSSGTEFSIYPKHPRVREIKSYLNTRRYQLINSEVPAPGHLGFDSPACVHAPATAAVFAEFITKQGGFDVIHFNNLEGLPVEVLALKEQFKETKFLFSLHNYYAVCPQVNLWWREKENCEDYNDGKNCPACLDYEPNLNWVKKANLLSRTLQKIGMSSDSRLHRLVFHLIHDVYRQVKQIFSRKQKTELKLIEPISSSPRKYQQHRRQDFTRYINTYCDTVLAVSARVAEVATKFGVDPSITRTSYIGTKVAESYESPDLSAIRRRLAGKETITIGYMGYMRRDKGFYFLIDALETMPQSLTKKLNLIIAARMTDPSVMHRLSLLADSFNSVEFSDGYTHDMLDDIYNKLDLALVPVLWEDNLPQVAIESACHHTPVLSSNLGGAKEVGGANALFIFKANDKADLAARLQDFVDEPSLLLEYWNSAMVPVTMQEHISELLEIYGQPRREVLTAESDKDIIAKEGALVGAS